MSLVLQHRTEGLCRSHGIPARLPEAAATATGRVVVVTGNVAQGIRRFQFAHSIEKSAAELIIEEDFQRPVLVQDLATPHRFSKSLLDQKAIGRKLEEFALVGACRRNGTRFSLYGDQLPALPADVIRLAGQPMALGNQHHIRTANAADHRQQPSPISQQTCAPNLPASTRPTSSAIARRDAPAKRRAHEAS